VKVTREMIERARQAEFDHYQRNRLLGTGPFVGTSDAVIRAMLEATLGGGRPTAAALTNRVVRRREVAAIAKGKTTKAVLAVVTARKPKRQ
jgi:hypothetical protein